MKRNIKDILSSSISKATSLYAQLMLFTHQPGVAITAKRNLWAANATGSARTSTYLRCIGVQVVEVVPTLDEPNLDIYYDPAYEVKNNPAGGFTTGITNLQQQLRSITSQISDITIGQLGKYIFAITSLYCAIVDLKKAMRIMYSFDTYNVTFGKTLKQAMADQFGVSIQNELQTKANTVAAFNDMIRELSTIKLPAGIGYIDRWMHMLSNLFAEEDMDKAQLTMFVNHYIYEYCVSADAETSEIGNVCLKEWLGEYGSFIDYITQLRRIIAIYTADTDCNKVAAVLKQAIDAGKIRNWEVAELHYDENDHSVDENIDVFVDRSLTDALKNATYIGQSPVLNNWQLIETSNGQLHLGRRVDGGNNSPSYLYVDISTHPDGNGAQTKFVPESSSRMIYLSSDNPSGEEIAAALTFTCQIAENSPSGVNWYGVVQASGIAMVVGATYYYFNEKNEFLSITHRAIITKDELTPNMLRDLLMISQVVGRLRTYYIASKPGATGQNDNFSEIYVGDIDNYQSVDYEIIGTLHTKELVDCWSINKDKSQRKDPKDKSPKDPK